VSSVPQSLTDAQVDEQLRRILDEIETLQRRWAAGALTPAVQPGSSLAGDDAKTRPYELSHAVTHTTSVAVEHLHALKVLLGTGTLHNSAPYALVRSAIEAASTGLWLLGPRSRSARVLRRLSLANEDAHDGSRAAAEMGLPVPRPLAERTAQLTALAQSAAGPTAKLEGVKFSAVVAEAGRHPGVTMRSLAAWQVCSGFAHGRTWSSLSLLEREVVAHPQPGVVLLSLTNRLGAVLWAVGAASELVNATLALFAQRAASPHGPPEDHRN
jgi:hypothetical protein